MRYICKTWSKAYSMFYLISSWFDSAFASSSHLPTIVELKLTGTAACNSHSAAGVCFDHFAHTARMPEDFLD